jgi:hypothetical protein
MSKVKKKKADPVLPYKQLKDGSYKIYNWRVSITPSPAYPDMVSVENKNLEIYKRFITFDKAIQWIEKEHIERFAKTTGKKVPKELKTIGMGVLINTIE